MTRVLSLFALLLLVASAWAQKAPTLIGAWVLDPKSVPVAFKSRILVLTFKTGGKYAIKSAMGTSEGTYSMANGKVFMIPSSVNGKRVSSGSGDATGSLTSGGKVLLIESGPPGMKKTSYRWIRKK